MPELSMEKYEEAKDVFRGLGGTVEEQWFGGYAEDRRPYVYLTISRTVDGSDAPSVARMFAGVAVATGAYLTMSCHGRGGASFIQLAVRRLQTDAEIAAQGKDCTNAAS